MNADNNQRIHWELSEAVIGAAMVVLNTLKPGLKEKAYENALVIELRKRGHLVEQQRQFDVFYDGVVVDTLIPDNYRGRKSYRGPEGGGGFHGFSCGADDRLYSDHWTGAFAAPELQTRAARLETGGPLTSANIRVIRG